MNPFLGGRDSLSLSLCPLCSQVDTRKGVHCPLFGEDTLFSLVCVGCTTKAVSVFPSPTDRTERTRLQKAQWTGRNETKHNRTTDKGSKGRKIKEYQKKKATGGTAAATVQSLADTTRRCGNKKNTSTSHLREKEWVASTKGEIIVSISQRSREVFYGSRSQRRTLWTAVYLCASQSTIFFSSSRQVRRVILMKTKDWHPSIYPNATYSASFILLCFFLSTLMQLV